MRAKEHQRIKVVAKMYLVIIRCIRQALAFKKILSSLHTVLDSAIPISILLKLTFSIAGFSGLFVMIWAVSCRT